MKLLVVAILIGSVSALFTPPYYGGFENQHERDHGVYGKTYGNYNAENGKYGNGYDRSHYDQDHENKGNYGNQYGDRAYADGHSGYDKEAANGHYDAEHDQGFKKENDADGLKKYEYFSAGSGPEGSYQKGYYGSEGYDHESAASKYNADAAGSGYKKGYNAGHVDHDDAKSSYEKDSGAHSGYGAKHDSASSGHSKGGFSGESHDDGWYNGKQEHDQAHKGGIYH